MAIARLNFYSRALNMDTCVNVLLPEKRLEWPEDTRGKKYPVLYLLHGHCQDHNAWLNNSRISWYLKNQDVIVVFPNGDRESYVDGMYTHMYQTYLTQELPLILKNWLPISDRREDTYIGGMSMGGYGALNAALNYPEIYGGVIAMSPALDQFSADKSDNMREKGGPPVNDRDAELNMYAIFGDEAHFRGSSYDIMHCLEKIVQTEGESPDIYLCCGEDDFLLEQSRALAEKAEKLGIHLTFEVSPGMHNWDYWDREIITGLKFFHLLPENYERK